MILVAIDPSLRSSGLAIFQEGVLVYAGAVKSRAEGDIALRALTMAAEICQRVRRVFPDDAAQVVVEWPQIYRSPKAKGDPNDLPTVAAVGVAAAALLRAAALTSYQPCEWLNLGRRTTRPASLPKFTSGDCKASPRAIRIRSRLLGPEVAVWEAIRSSDHDAIDAVGIGCHALGRRQAAEGTKGLLSCRPGARGLPPVAP